MRILLANDDGYDAPGLKALAESLSAEHDIIVVAPESNRSGFSHALTIDNELTVKKIQTVPYEVYAISGTPADCVKLGVLHLSTQRIDLIISGINNGANLGSDIMYSGTVSAAFDGAYLGIRSVAVSLTRFNCEYSKYQEVAAFVKKNLEEFIKQDLPVSTIININYPFNCIGAVCASVGINIYSDKYLIGEKGLKLTGVPIKHDKNTQDSDVELIRKGYATISTLQLDRNDYESLKKIKKANFIL